MPESNLLAETRELLATKTKRFHEANEAAKADDGSEDYSRAAVLEKLGASDMADAKSKVMALGVEIQEIGAQLDSLTLKSIKDAVASQDERMKRPIRPNIPGAPLSDEPKSFGELVVESKSYLELAGKSKMPGQALATVEMGVKAVMSTTAGWAPRAARTGRVVDFAIRPPQILDFIPVDQTDQFEIRWMEETTRTQSEAEVAESGTYAEDVFVFTERTSPVRKIGSQIPITDEQLDDVPQSRALVDNRLRFGLSARVDQQVIAGTGAGVTLTGIVSTAGIQTQAKGADSIPAAVLKSLTKVRVTGRAAPNAIFMHPTNWETTRLLTNAAGDFQFGSPLDAGDMRMWGLPVVLCESLTVGTALVGDYANYCQLLERKQIEVQVGWIASQFIIGQKTLRADVRVAFCVYRPAAFATVTGL